VDCCANRCQRQRPCLLVGGMFGGR